MEDDVREGRNAKGEGILVPVSEAEAEDINYTMISSMGDMENTPCCWVKAKHPVELLFFRRIFTKLRQQNENLPWSEEHEEYVPIQAFQRAMGRLFFLLGVAHMDAKMHDRNGSGWMSWGDFCTFWKERRLMIRLSLTERIYLTFDDPSSSPIAKLVSIITLCTILLSSVCFIISTVPEFQDLPDDGSRPKPDAAFERIELLCLVIFVGEYILRLCTCWSRRPEILDKVVLLDLTCGYEEIRMRSRAYRLAEFVFNVSNLIDLLAILPPVISLFVKADGGGFVVLRLVRLTRIFRAVRLGKMVEPVVVIARTVKQSTKALSVLAFNLLLGVVIFGSLMFLIEGGEWDDSSRSYLRQTGRVWNATIGDFEELLERSPFESIPHAFWWALVTSTTVGYGDHHPKTSFGYCVAAALMIWSLVILALPVGVIGGTFTQVWEDFLHEKRREADDLRKEMWYVAQAVQRLEPSKVSRMMLIEVWNDSGGALDSLPGNADDFMGQAEVMLDLPASHPVSRTLRLVLKPNEQKVKRRIRGHVTIRYEWTPNKSTQGETFTDTFKGIHPAPIHHSNELILSGTLRLTLLSAEELINTRWMHPSGKSSPYGVLMCYPVSPDAGGFLMPVVWRSPTARVTLAPTWEASVTFNFAWYGRVVADVAGMGALENEVDEEDTRVERFCLGAIVLPVRRSNSSDTKKHKAESRNDEAILKELRSLASGLPQLMGELRQVREEVRTLSYRVDELAGVRPPKELPPVMASASMNSMGSHCSRCDVAPFPGVPPCGFSQAGPSTSGGASSTTPVLRGPRPPVLPAHQLEETPMESQRPLSGTGARPNGTLDAVVCQDAETGDFGGEAVYEGMLPNTLDSPRA